MVFNQAQDVFMVWYLVKYGDNTFYVLTIKMIFPNISLLMFLTVKHKKPEGGGHQERTTEHKGGTCNKCKIYHSTGSQVTEIKVRGSVGITQGYICNIQSKHNLYNTQV
jgi:hypothetical protein